MANLATLVAKVEAIANNFDKVIDNSIDRIDKLEKQAEKANKASAASFADLKNSISGTLVKIGALILAFSTLKTFTDAWRDSLEDAKFAHIMGDDLQSLTRMRGVFRLLLIDAKSLNDILISIGKTISKAQSDTVLETVFKRIGLDIAELDRMRPTESFEKIVDALASVDDKTRQATYTVQLFGDKASDVFRLVSQGKEGIRALKEQVAQFGYVLNNTDMDKLESSAKRFEAVSLRVEGAMKGIAIETGPLFAEFIERLANLGNNVDNVEEKFRGLGKVVGFSFVVILNIILTVKLAIQGVVQFIIDAITTLTINLSSLLAIVSKLKYLPGPSGDIGKIAEEMAKGLGKIQAANLNANENITKDVQKTIDQLNDLNKPGKFAEDAEKKTKQIADNTQKAAEQSKELARNMERMLRGLDTQRNVMTPVEKFKQSIKDLREQLKIGAIDLKTFGRAGYEEINRLAEAMGDKQVNFAGAEQYGSKEAYSSIIRYQFQDERLQESPEKRLERLFKAQEVLDIERNKLLEKAVDALNGKQTVNM